MNKAPTNVTMKYLRTFVAIVETGSYDGAAIVLFNSSNTLRHHVSKLEQELGFELFKPSRNFRQPTTAGKFVYDAAIELLADHDEFVARCKEYAARHPTTFW